MSDHESIGDLTTHVSGSLDGTEQWAALSGKRAGIEGKPNVRISIGQVVAYAIANGAGGGALANQADQTVLGNNSGGSAQPTALSIPTLISMFPTNGIVLSKLTQISATSFIGNPTGGVATASAMSAATAASILPAVVGDSGAGGTKGLVPAPAAGDAAAAKFLKADGTWAVPGGSGLVAQANNTLFGNVSGASAVPSSMTAAQARTLLGISAGALSAAPSSPSTGMTAIADGVNWDPLGRHEGEPYEVLYTGSVWISSTAAHVHPGYVAGRWYGPPVRPNSSTSALQTDVMKMFPIMFNRPVTLSDFGLRIGTASAGGHLKVALYASNPTTKMPTGTALASVTLATDTVANVSATLGTPIAITQPGLYWFGVQSDNSVVQCNSIALECGPVANMIGASTMANIFMSGNGATNGQSVSAPYASGLPDLTAASFGDNTTANVPIVVFKVSSVP